MFARYLILLLVLYIPANTFAEVIVYDHFDDGVLDPAWEVVFNEFACGWTYSEEVSDLRVTEICHDGNALDWAIVSLAQPCVAPADFSVAWKIAWHTPYGLPDTMQVLYLILYDETGEAIAITGFNDAWVQYQGRMVAWVRGTDGYESGGLPWSGTATVIVYRVGEMITFEWDNEVIFEAPEPTPVASIGLQFYYTYYGSTSTAINESVDFVRVTDSVVTAAPGATPYAGPILAGIYPNPFNPQTTITFALARPQHAEVAVYDLTGRLLGVLADRNYDAGNHSIVWNGKDAIGRAVPSGIYVVRLETESAVEARKVMLAR